MPELTPRKLAVTVVALVLIIDQLSKLAAAQLISAHEPLALIPLLDLKLAHNTGAAFSFLSNAGGWQRWFLATLSAAVSIFLAIWIHRLAAGEKLTGLALAMVLGGAIGNLIDRVILGHVIDFIDFYYFSSGECLPLFYGPIGHKCHFPTFNIADAAITTGAALLILGGLAGTPKGKGQS